jgi:hypothetical protein
MSDVDLTGSDWLENWEGDLPIPEHHAVYDRANRYCYLPDQYPTLPNFGILYLSVPRAASLIVDDLVIHNRSPFRKLQTTKENLSDSQREDLAEKHRPELTAQVEARLLQEIASGRLASVTAIKDMEDVTQRIDEQNAASRTYIFYGNLLRWLALSGYPKQFLLESSVFGDYEDIEIALAKKVERLIFDHREMEGYSTDELRPFKKKEFFWKSYDEEGPDLHRVLSPVILENRALKQRLAQVQRMQKRLHSKEEASILIVLAALLEERGYEDWNNGLVSKVAKKAERLLETVSINTVRTMLGKAMELIEKSS